MSCVATVTQTLEGFERIEKATYVGNRGTFLLDLKGELQPAEVAESILQAGLSHDKRLGHTDRPPWVMKVIPNPKSEQATSQ